MIRVIFWVALAVCLLLALVGRIEEAAICAFALGYPGSLVTSELALAVGLLAGDRSLAGLSGGYNIVTILGALAAGWVQWFVVVPALLSRWRGAARLPATRPNEAVDSHRQGPLSESEAARANGLGHAGVAVKSVVLLSAATLIQVWMWGGLRRVGLVNWAMAESGRFGSLHTTVLLTVPTLAAAIVCAAILKAHFHERGEAVPKNVAALLVISWFFFHFIGFVSSLYLRS
jgi:hypothetical protein